MSVLALLAVLATMLLAATSAAASPISRESLGVNIETPTISGKVVVPTDLATASANGLGVVRKGIDDCNNADSLVTLLAKADLRYAPALGLCDQYTPSGAASAMATFITKFAARYGPGGTFWTQNPTLPYLPVETFEIGNEPNLPLQWVVDGSHLHWTDPSAYAQVYEAARAALHKVDSSGIVVVGGLADSGNLGVDLAHDEEWLGAISGTVDAVGFHPYTFPVSFPEMYSDTQALRQWMNAHGMSSAPIEINEYGACDILPQDTLNTGSGCEPSISSADWGTFAANFTKWALCTPSLHVGQTLPFSWGDLPTTDVNAVLALVTSGGALTPYGQDYLNVAKSLTTAGCPASTGGGGGGSSSGGGGGGGSSAVSGTRTARMSLWLSSVRVRGHRLTVIVREIPGSGRIAVLARKGRRRVWLRLTRQQRHHTVLTFSLKLATGRWKLTVWCTPPRGYANHAPLRHMVTVRR